jgi:hypothetical protein
MSDSFFCNDKKKDLQSNFENRKLSAGKMSWRGLTFEKSLTTQL